MDPDQVIESDLTVVGGGIAGICAAVEAARLGLDTALVNDRPVLGGCSSSEIRVWINGATGGAHNRYVREGGIVEEMTLENKARNPDGNADLWDTVLHDLAGAEENLDVYLNLLVDQMGTDGGRVEWVGGTQNMSERTFRFESPLFVDATGDGAIANRTGAEWRQGREAASVYDEVAAPEEADTRTLGSSIMFYSERADEPVEYTPPDFAKDFKDNPPEILAKRAAADDRRCLYWWIEYGGQEELDPISDNEEIRDELWAMVYGAWDYIKNSGVFPEEEVADLKLEWTGKIPGKRESRRFVGDYVLNENDLVEQRRFDDTVGHGGWSIDLHPPSGFYDDQGRGSEHWHLDGPYRIPYRTLYPKGSENLFLAGRHVSASHVAFGSLRVQKTLGTLGQAVGTAAALALEHDAAPGDVGEEHTDTLQQTLLREDQWVVGQANEDPADHAPEATVRASSTHPASVRDPDTEVALDSPIGVHFSTDEPVESVELLLEADTDADLSVEVYDEERPENYVPHERRAAVEVSVPSGGPQWVEIPFGVNPGDGQGVYVVLEGSDAVTLHARERELTGVVASRASDGHDHTLVPEAHIRQTRWPPTDWVPCFDMSPDPGLYAPESVVDGYARPYGLPHGWCSEPFDTGQAEPTEGAWVELAWDEPRTLAAVQLAFNTRLTENYNPLTPMPETEVPEVVRDYRVEYEGSDGWVPLTTVTGNYQRFRRHTFDPVEIERLRVSVEATNGVPWAEIFEIRAYGPDQWPPLRPV